MSDNVSIFLVGLLFLASICCYCYSVWKRSGSTDPRVLQQGSSVFLNSFFMDYGIWMMRPVASFLNRIGARPDQVTFASLLFAVLAAIFISLGKFGNGFCLAIAAGCCDMLDGMLARIQHKTELSGKVFDSLSDRYVDFMLLAACAVYYREELPLLMASLLSIHGSYMISYTTAKAEELKVHVPRGAMKRTERYVYLLAGLALTTIFAAVLREKSVYWMPLAVVLMFLAVMTNYWALIRFIRLFHGAKETSPNP